MAPIERSSDDQCPCSICKYKRQTKDAKAEVERLRDALRDARHIIQARVIDLEERPLGVHRRGAWRWMTTS